MPTLPQGQAEWGHLGVFNDAQFALLDPLTYVGKQCALDDGAGTVTQYVSNGTEWQAVGGSSPAAFTAGAVHFDGANTSLVNAALASGADSGLLSFSFWVYWRGSEGTGGEVWTVDAENNFSSSMYYHSGGSSSDSDFGSAGRSDRLLINDGNQLPLQQWAHVICSVDASTGEPLGKLYVNGVEKAVAAVAAGALPFVIAIDGLSFRLGEDTYSEGIIGDLAEFWFAPGQSLLNESGEIPPETIAKFYNAGAPVDLGADGSTPTGTAPAIYFHATVGDEVATFPVNQGTGGEFSVVGTLAAATTHPGAAPAQFASQHLSIDYSAIAESSVTIPGTALRSVTIATTFNGWTGARSTFASLDLSACTLLDTILVYRNDGQPFVITLPTTTTLTHLNLSISGMTPGDADTLLATLDDSGAVNGFVYVYAIPTAAGLASITSLTGKGWSCSYD